MSHILLHNKNPISSVGICGNRFREQVCFDVNRFDLPGSHSWLAEEYFLTPFYELLGFSKPFLSLEDMFALVNRSNLLGRPS